jgi:hypothetical protein
MGYRELATFSETLPIAAHGRNGYNTSVQGAETERHRSRHQRVLGARPMAEAVSEMRRLALRRRLDLAVDESDGAYVVWSEEFRIHGVGDTPDAALRDFEQNVIAVYESYVEEPPDELSEGAKKLRHKLARAFLVR